MFLTVYCIKWDGVNMNSYYSRKELESIGFKEIGGGIQLSRKASIYSPQNITIGDNVRIDDFCILSGNITIGDYVHIAAGVYLFGGNAGIILSDFTGISSRCAIYAESDDYTGLALTNPTVPDEFRRITGGTVKLEKHALIGTGCTILPNVIIGEGTSVGSMALVTKSLDSWGIYVGIPCRRLKERSKQILDVEVRFLESQKT